MIIGPKYKICKRLGSAVFEQCQTQKFSLSEARAGEQKRGGRPGGASEYKRQLTEKQKMRFSYGVSERQLSRYVIEAMATEGDPAKTLLNRLESRLDNVVYRTGIAKTRRLARQMVSHGHILVNGKKTTIPSYEVKVSDVISVRDGSKESPLFSTLEQQLTDATVPAWLRFDAKALSGSKTAEPQTHVTEFLFDPVQVLEFYSR